MKIEEIKELIKSGFDLELISAELEIPIDTLKKYKLEMETRKKSNITRTYSAREIIESKNSEAHSKMEKMRERYKRLFFRTNKAEVVSAKELSKQEVELINMVITKVEELVKEMKTLLRKERIEPARTILSELEKIKDYQLNIKQAEKLYSLMQSEELKGLDLEIKGKHIRSTDKIEQYINKKRIDIINKLVKAVDIAQSQTEEIEELGNLNRILTIEISQINPVQVGAVRGRIERKMENINQQKAVDRVRNDIPTSIDSIIEDIVNGTLDIEVANEIIAEEAKKRVESKPKTRFTLTEEQEKRQIKIQIRNMIMEKPEQYHIENPETTVMLIQELFGGELEQAIRTVVRNLIAIKDFESAKAVCNEFVRKDEKGTLLEYITMLKKDIRNAEISDIVLKGINMEGTEDEDRRYFELIEKGLRQTSIKLSAISLGKSQDGSKNITLADIWTDEKQREI